MLLLINLCFPFLYQVTAKMKMVKIFTTCWIYEMFKHIHTQGQSKMSWKVIQAMKSRTKILNNL